MPKKAVKAKFDFSIPDYIIGLDLSLKSSGYAIYNTGLDNLLSGFLNTYDFKLSGMERIVDISSEIVGLLVDLKGTKRVFIEGYGFNSFRAADLAELGGVVRYNLYFHQQIPYINVPPLTLKKFILGKGKGDKDLILKEMYKRYGYDFDSNDEADAVALVELGKAVFGLNKKPLNQPQKDVISNITS